MIVLERNGKIIGIYSGDWDVRNDTLYVRDEAVFYPALSVEIHEVPEQDLSHLIEEDESGTRIKGAWPDDISLQYTKEELSAIQATRIDRETGREINSAMHPHAALEEQIGILRDQLVHILNALGIEPTEEFAKFNEIAIKEIEAARKKKEALDESDSA